MSKLTGAIPKQGGRRLPTTPTASQRVELHPDPTARPSASKEEVEGDDGIHQREDETPTQSWWGQLASTIRTLFFISCLREEPERSPQRARKEPERSPSPRFQAMVAPVPCCAPSGKVREERKYLRSWNRLTGEKGNEEERKNKKEVLYVLYSSGEKTNKKQAQTRASHTLRSESFDKSMSIADVKIPVVKRRPHNVVRSNGTNRGNRVKGERVGLGDEKKGRLEGKNYGNTAACNTVKKASEKTYRRSAAQVDKLRTFQQWTERQSKLDTIPPLPPRPFHEGYITLAAFFERR